MRIYQAEVGDHVKLRDGREFVVVKQRPFATEVLALVNGEVPFKQPTQLVSSEAPCDIIERTPSP